MDALAILSFSVTRAVEEAKVYEAPHMASGSSGMHIHRHSLNNCMGTQIVIILCPRWVGWVGIHTLLKKALWWCPDNALLSGSKSIARVFQAWVSVFRWSSEWNWVLNHTQCWIFSKCRYLLSMPSLGVESGGETSSKEGSIKRNSPHCAVYQDVFAFEKWGSFDWTDRSGNSYKYPAI